VQLHFTTRVRYGFLSVQLNYTIRRPVFLKISMKKAPESSSSASFMDYFRKGSS
jgi:hypothetical protein